MNLDVRIVIPGLALQLPDPLAVGLGGSETAGLQLAATFARAGHTVSVFCNIQEYARWRGCQMLPINRFPMDCAGMPFDLLLAQRDPTLFAIPHQAKAAFFWVHDLAQARFTPNVMGGLHGMDRILTVSAFQARQWREINPDLPEKFFTVGRNGVDLDLIREARAEVAGQPRDLKRLVYTARPERGLEPMLGVFERILAQVPDATLHLAAYDVPNPGIEPYYRMLYQRAAAFGDRIQVHGSMPKKDLYKLFATSGLYVYPCPSPVSPAFAETSCISAMEAMACGLPWISTDRGALPETVGTAGRLIRLEEATSAGDERVLGELAEAAVMVLSDPALARELSEAGENRADGFGWGPLADQLVTEAHVIAEAACADPYRLARHFYVRQDIDAVVRVIEREEAKGGGEIADPRLRGLSEKIDREYAHRLSPKALAKFYSEQVGPGNQHVTDMLMNAPPERFREAPFIRFAHTRDAIARQLLAQQGGVNEPDVMTRELRILDWGCAQGECAIVLANNFAGGFVLGVDAAPDEVRRAGELAAKHADDPARIKFRVGNEADFSCLDDQEPFDVLVITEVLEHLCDPKSTLQRLERMVRPGGVVVLTVPYGPWEYQQHAKGEGRQHLREWEAADIHDLFGAKRRLQIERTPMQACPITGLPLGVTQVSYVADQQPLGKIDWTRKLSWQSPRQTLSVCMMIGGAQCHDTLHWCLGSIRDLADEIVIADAGMTAEAHRIAAVYGARTIKSESPLKVGFEAPRNLALDQCAMDWVFMIDADERLMAGQALGRYLREHPFHTFSIRQHHLAVDAAWKPDLPGRIFRRRPEWKSGKTMRFYGMLHEHAELAVNEGTGLTVVLPDVQIAHVGYLDNNARIGRFERNLPLLHADFQKYPSRKLMLLVVMRDSMIQARYVLATKYQRDFNQPGSALGTEAQPLALDTIRIWRENFKDDKSMMAVESAEFYHDACRMMASPVLAEVSIAISRDGIGLPSPNAKHFASIDDVEAMIASRLKVNLDAVGREGW